MCVVEKTLYKNNGERVATYETHLAAVRAMLNDWDEDENYRDVPLELDVRKLKPLVPSNSMYDVRGCLRK